MTPHEINVLLHIHTMAEPFSPDSESYRSSISIFTMKGLIYKTDSGSGYQTTETGETMVNMLCETPYPVPTNPRLIKDS